MIFFFFSLLASIAGGLSAGNYFNISLNVGLAVNNPFAGVIAYWPYIIIFVILLLALLWYMAIKNIKRNSTQAGRRHRHGLQSPWLLGVFTLVMVVLVFSPYLIQSMGDTTPEIQTISAEDRVEMVLTVHGMDCTGCESLINTKVSEIAGVDSVSASHVREEVLIIYDKTRVNLDQITQAIETSGYTVVLE